MDATALIDGAEYEDGDGDVWIYDAEHGVFRSKLVTGEAAEGTYSPWAPDKLEAKYGPLKPAVQRCPDCKKATAPVTREELLDAFMDHAAWGYTTPEVVSGFADAALRLLAEKGLA